MLPSSARSAGRPRTRRPRASRRSTPCAASTCSACWWWAGWAWGLHFPIIKNLWSSSFVLWAGGWSFLLLAAFAGVTEGLRWTRWAYPLVVVGANSIVAYLLATLFLPVTAAFAAVFLGGLKQPAGDWHPVVMAAGTGAAGWLLLWWLYRRRVFVRI